MRFSPGRRQWIGIALAASVAVAGAAGASQKGRAQGAGAAGQSVRPPLTDSSGQRVIEVLAYQATGVRDSAAAATAVHCTNLGEATRTVYVDIYDFDGDLKCVLTDNIGSGETSTLVTRLTELYSEDDWCDVAPETDQGSLFVSVLVSNTVICTVQVVDPAHSTPTYVTTLDLFRP